jgi:hypothetical protein
MKIFIASLQTAQTRNLMVFTLLISARNVVLSHTTDLSVP